MIKHFILSDFSAPLNAQILADNNRGLISSVSIDSRKIYSGTEVLFVAIPGQKTDGHLFLGQAYDRGARNFIIQTVHDDIHYLIDQKDTTVLLVPDTVQALQYIATWSRQQYNGPVVAITGSNGKTILKEWLSQLLGDHFRVGKSPKSYNSQIGVPLSVFSLMADQQVVLLEAGISEPGEMDRLEKIIRPNIGLFTNLGTAHDQNFENHAQKLREKALLFSGCQFIIYRKDQKMVADYLEATFPANRLVSWSESEGADYTLAVKKGPSRTKIILMSPDLSLFSFSCAFLDEASLENVRHAIVACLTLGVNPSQIQEGISKLLSVEMRLTAKNGIRQCTIIDDTYNNDLGGLEIALEFMHVQRQKRFRKVILSDLPQVGSVVEAYKKVKNLLDHFKIDYVYGIGEQISKELSGLVPAGKWYASTDEFLQKNDLSNFDDDLVLIKGGRAFSFERIVQALEEKLHGTVLAINLNAITHNFLFYRKHIPVDTKVMVMVKAAGYGGGAVEIANHLQKLKADYVAVAYTDEGIQLRKHGINLPIMVLNVAAENFAQLKTFQLEAVVYSTSILQAIGAFSEKEEAEIPIHLDFDTGMHRLGFERKDFDDLVNLLGTFTYLRVISVFTHLAAADEQVHDVFSRGQLSAFEEMATLVGSTLGYKPLQHALNTSGIMRFPAYAMDMVRLGIGLYGIAIDDSSKGHLQQVVTLKTTISQIKQVMAGETVGYSRCGKVNRTTNIATINIGYADGYDRRFSNGIGYGLVNGQRAPVIGNICMDMTMLDLGDIPAKEGDQVTLFGEGINLSSLARKIGTIPYELLTQISSRVKRVYYLD